MEFRTPVHVRQSGKVALDLEHPVVFLGSCFADNMASRLARDGFKVLVNPGGPLYNPASIASVLTRALDERDFELDDLTEGPRGYHLLDFASRFSGEEAQSVLRTANDALHGLSKFLKQTRTLFITLGTAFVFETCANGKIVGNCHKIPASFFRRRMLSTDECAGILRPLIQRLSREGICTVITVSPVRHTADGLHGNTLSKATLHLAADILCKEFDDFVEYFPAFEAIIDDLRDYRFTGPDMKHPTEQAADYVYELFCTAFMSPDTLSLALENRKSALRAAHRPILDSR